MEPISSRLEKPLENARVLIVDDEEINRVVFSAMLGDEYQIDVAESGEEALAYCRETPPDLILMDVLMSGMDGMETCRLLKSVSDLAYIPVIFITALNRDDDENACWEAGCVDFVTKPVNGTTLKNRVKAHLTHKLQSDIFRRLIFVDGLTGAYNRHFLQDALPKLIKQSSRTQTPTAVIMLDVDWFKAYNDEYGHLQGDECLRQVARTITGVLKRPTDTLVRYGGEEFICLLPNTDHDGARHIAETIRYRIEQMAIKHIQSPFGFITVSAGVACCAPEQLATVPETLLEEADKNLYTSKKNGRNQTTLS